jgi:L-aminopeptidase/D-esterase-like protein
MIRLVLALLPIALLAQTETPANSTLTSIPGIRVGHHTLSARPTGCTVIVVEGGAVGGAAQRGAAPGTRETDLLHPTNIVDRVDAIVLSGGSAFGLIGALAAEAVADAIVRAATQAAGVSGIPAARDLRTAR